MIFTVAVVHILLLALIHSGSLILFPFKCICFFRKAVFAVSQGLYL